MKKVNKHYYLWLMMFLGLNAMASCKDDNSSEPIKTETPSFVEVTVSSEEGSPLSSVKVYMFDTPSTEVEGATPSKALMSAVTSASGVAKFDLKDITTVETGGTLYFTVIHERLVGNSVLGTTEAALPEEGVIQETVTIPYWGYNNGYMPTTLDNALALKEYNRWKNTQVVPCGNGLRVIADPSAETKVEAIGFGMLLAAYANDKETFDGLHNFYNAKRTPEAKNMMAWSVTCDGILDPGSASDGDVDVAFALIVASKVWDDAYLNDAKEILSLISSNLLKTCTVDGQSVQILAPGFSGVAWGGCQEMDIMYHTPAFFRVFAEVTENSIWADLADDTYVTLNAGAHPTTGLVPDWQTASGTPGPGTRVGYYGYDACRAPWRLTLDYLWNGNTQSQSWAKKIADWAKQEGPANIVDGYELDGTPRGTNGLNSAFLGGFAVATMASDPSTVNQFGSELSRLSDNYWFNLNTRCLYLFTLTGNFWNPLEE